MSAVTNKAPDLYAILEGAAGLIVMASRIENALLDQTGKDNLTVSRKELLAVSKINRLNAQIVDELVYRIERQSDHIKNLEAMIKILKAKT